MLPAATSSALLAGRLLAGWLAMSDAGYEREKVRIESAHIGVFVGISGSEAWQRKRMGVESTTRCCFLQCDPPRDSGLEGCLQSAFGKRSSRDLHCETWLRLNGAEPLRAQSNSLFWKLVQTV